MRLCDWSNYQEELESIKELIARDIEVIQPLSFLSLADDLNFQLKCASIFVKKYLKPVILENNFKKKLECETLNIGYFSADFHSHATMHLFAEILERHNRKKFKIFGFSFGPPYEDHWRQRAKNACDEFLDIRSLSDLEIAKLAREKEIDIAIDLKGFTEDCRPSIFAYRVAPIQMNYLGYPGTVAAPYMDYIVADKILIDEESKKHYQEKIIFLPHSYQPNCLERDIANTQLSWKQFGLPENSIVFCCFNSNHKITPQIFDAWMTILRNVNHSILWLHVSDETAKNNLLTEAIKRNIEAGRIIFAQTVDVEEHLPRLRLADIFLDTYPYNAHTTASDALRMGLPIITLRGHSFVSRVAASLLSSIGMDQLIASSLEDYISMAIHLASDKNKLSELKNEINRAVTEGSLFNSDNYTNNYETSLIAAYQNFVKNNEPRDIKVDNF
jgi:predicted O-linked N-acetylglucosamine transferase (SPINDLY family)